tara:strand:- start:146 stop:622 length:477 start_codon:yes stop_codon:yes gene_type:complete
MKNIVGIITILFFISCSTNAQKKQAEKIYPVNKTNTEWKKKLSKIQYYVLRESGTEKAYSSPLNKISKKGVYVCAACNSKLYRSENKFDSGSGWPSFDRAIKENVELDVDYKIGYARTELKCYTCGSHLGHSFDDGPRKTTGKRHCINGAALLFIPNK